MGIGSGTATCELYRAFFFRQNVDIEPDTEVATSDLLIPLIRAGMGIGFVPERMAQPWLDAGQLVRIPLDCEPPGREIRLVYDSGRGKSGGTAEVPAEVRTGTASKSVKVRLQFTMNRNKVISKNHRE